MIDTRVKSATINGTSVIGALNYLTSSWPRLAPGANYVRLTGAGTDPDTSVTVSWRAAYV